MNSSFTFAVVGGGLTATSMLCQLVEKARERAVSGRLEPRNLKLAFFEKSADFGPGFPHNGRYLMPFHITNMCAGDMGVYADRRGDFQAWVDRNIDVLKKRFSDYPEKVFRPVPGPSGCRHFPRAFMGEYLRTRFAAAVEDARRLGMTVALYPSHEVTEVHPEETGVKLVATRTESGERLHIAAGGVLLATGHWFPENRLPNYFDSPWPARRLLESIPPGASVAVLGSSLSAIETALTLTSDGRFVGRSDTGLNYIPPKRPRKITLYSRGGRLPKVRGAVGERKNVFLTPAGIENIRGTRNGRLSLKATFDLLDAELSSAYGRPVDWQSVLYPGGNPADALERSLCEAQTGDGPAGEVLWQTVLGNAFAFVRRWYLDLAEEERRRFDRSYTSLFFTHAATQPHINAAKLLSLMRSGQVSVVALGSRYRLRREAAGGSYRFDYNNRNHQPVTERYRYVVDARGQRRSMESDPSELAHNLLSSMGSAPISGPAGRFIRIDPRTHQVVSGEPANVGAIYAVGAMTRHQIIDASMAHGLCQSTAVVAKQLLDRVNCPQSG